MAYSYLRVVVLFEEDESDAELRVQLHRRLGLSERERGGGVGCVRLRGRQGLEYDSTDRLHAWGSVCTICMHRVKTCVGAGAWRRRWPRSPVHHNTHEKVT